MEGPKEMLAIQGLSQNEEENEGLKRMKNESITY